jgi:hypothetical protein
MLEKGVIERVHNPRDHWISRVFTVPKGTGGSRFIIDLHLLNTFIPCPTFKMISHHRVRQLLPKGSWTSSIDLESAYFHIPIHPAWQRFLAFSLDGTTYRFKALPFGLNIAPRIFTKVLKEVLALLHLEGIQIIAYLDDILIWAPSKDVCRDHTTKVLQTLISFGFLINQKKSRLIPSQSFTFLGIDWSLLDHSWGVTQEKKLLVSTQIKKFRIQKRTSKRDWEQLLGLLNFIAPLIPGGQLHRHDLLLEVNAWFRGMDRDQQSSVPYSIRRLLSWWKPSILGSRQALLAPTTSHQIMTDASKKGWGAVSAGISLTGLWDHTMLDRHSNEKELMTIVIALQRFPLTPNSTVLFFSDNKATVACVNRQGSPRSVSLQKISHRVFQVAKRKSVHVSARYIPGVLNTEADALSRTAPVPSEWSLDLSSFCLICNSLGVPEVDLFASRNNAKLPLFISPFPDLKAIATDALSTDWNRWEFIYLFPPVGLLPKVLQKLRFFQGRAIVIAPYWPKASWLVPLQALLPKQLILPSPKLSQTVQGVRTTCASRIFSDIRAFHS